MKADPRFASRDMSFWACVRSLSQHIGYSKKTVGVIVPTIAAMAKAFAELELDPTKIIAAGEPTALARDLNTYFQLRAELLNDHVQPRLMDAARAKKEYEKVRRRLTPACPLPKNKQKGDKSGPAYLTCLVNMLFEEAIDELDCDYDPRELTTITRDGLPVRTLARRVDGAFS